MRVSRGFHDSVNDRVDRVHAVKDTMPFRGTMFAKVFSPDGSTERVNVETVTGEKLTSFAYPFSSPNAWMRGQPENTTTMISIIGADTKDILPVGYYDPQKAAVAATYQTLAAGVRQNPDSIVGNNAVSYRTLDPGEIDLGSRGAQAFFGMRDVAQMRGGLSHHTMTSLYTRMETPLLRIEGPGHVLSGNLNDEVRFGTVRRSVANESNPTLPSLVIGDGQRRFDAPGSPLAPLFAKEWAVLLDWHGDPAKLIDHRQGIVTDDDGSFPKGGPNRKPLRARYRWFTTAGVPGSLNFTTTEIDEGGNVLFETSADATDGVGVLVPDGDFHMKVGDTRNGQFSVVTQGDAQLVTEAGSRFAIVADGGFRINTPDKGEVFAKSGMRIASDGIINIDAKPGSGIALGKREKQKYPILVAHPDYLSTYNSVMSSINALASAIQTYAGNIAGALPSIGADLMIIDQSGVTMGLCNSAASSASTMASAAGQVPSAIGQHLPKLAKMPSGFVSAKTVSE
jgi:filamentous hemagglutinin family protein